MKMNELKLDIARDKLNLMGSKKRAMVVRMIRRALMCSVSSYRDGKIQCGHERLYFAILSSAISDALMPASCNNIDEATAKRYLLGGSLDDLVLIGLELDYIHRVICQGANYERQKGERS